MIELKKWFRNGESKIEGFVFYIFDMIFVKVGLIVFEVEFESGSVVFDKLFICGFLLVIDWELIVEWFGVE